MASEKEYIVILHRNVDFEKFNEDMIASTGSGAIPSRSVDVTNARPGSQRMTHYSLTDEEATELKSHPSVFDVEIPPWDNPDIVIELIGSGTGPSGNFRRHGTIKEFSAGEGYPWFFPRHGGIVSNKLIDPYLDTSTNLNVADYNGTYTYVNSGEGVDIVIQDSGIDADNIEFTDSNGVSRVQKINWATESGVGSFPSAYLNDYYRDWDGHGTHVASTAAGRSMGWAKDARIYAQKLPLGAQGSNIEVGMQQSTSYADAFDQIKEWHKAKPIESNGFKRPTIVNMSWTTLKYLRSDYIGSITHRGTTYSSDSDLRPNQDVASDHVHRNLQYGFGYKFISGSDLGIHRTTILPAITSTILVDVEELIDAGVHVCVAAANSNYYISKPGHADYDNSYTIVNPPGQPTRTDTGTHYNHRGASPMHPDAHIVGSIGSGFRQTYTSADIVTQNTSATGPYKAEVASSSGRGPGVNIYHPGQNILGASSQAGPLLDTSGNVFISSPNKAVAQGATEITNPLDSTEKLMKFSGTSMASPGVAGILACILEDNPDLSPAELKEVIATSACGATIEDEMQEGFPQTDAFKVVQNVSGTTAGWYSHLGAINGPMGGPNRMIFNSPTGFNVGAVPSISSRLGISDSSASTGAAIVSTASQNPVTPAFETTLLDPSTSYTNGLYFVKVVNVTKNTEVTAQNLQSGVDATNGWGGNYTVLDADINDEIIVTIQANDETTGSNDMVFLKAESDEDLSVQLGGFLEPDGNHVFLNRFASEQDSSSPASQFLNLLPLFGIQPIINSTGFIPKGDISLSGWDTEAFQALEVRNANAGDRWQFGIKFKINSENFNALHIKVHGGHPNAVSGAQGTIMTVRVPITVASVTQNPSDPTPGAEPSFPLDLINTENLNNGVHWAKIKNVTKGTQKISSPLGFPMGNRYVFEALEAAQGDTIVLTLQVNDAIETGSDEVYAVATPGLGVTSATVGGLLRPDDDSITFFNPTTGTTPFPSMSVPNPITSNINNIVTFPTDTIDTDVGADYENVGNLNDLLFPANTRILTVGDADPGERWQVSVEFTIPNSTSLGTHAIAIATRQGQGAPSFSPAINFLVNEFRFPIKVTTVPTTSTPPSQLSEGPATDINYLRETKLFLFQNNAKYEIVLDGEFDFSQTFSEKSTSSNTLHNIQHFESASIVKANPASFEFRVNLPLQNDAQILFENLLNPAFCDLYFQTSHATFKLSRAVFTNGNFEIARNSILKLSISGEAAVLQRIGDETASIPGIAVVRNIKRTAFVPGIDIFLNNREISLLIANIQAELQNDIKWVPYETVNQAVKVVARGNAMYPSNFVLNKKIFAGSITKYVAVGDEATLLNFDQEAPLRIKAGKTISDVFYGLDFNMASCSFTNRVNPREIYTQNFDWRLTSNADLNGILKYFTLT